jgi:anti-sigma B factor antagonist
MVHAEDGAYREIGIPRHDPCMRTVQDERISMNHLVEMDGDVTVLHIRGELDALSCSDIRPVLDAIVEDGKRTVVVNLSELRLIDSSGVGAIVSLYKRVRANGGEVRFVGVTAQPLAIFKLLRLDHAFELA